MSPSIVETAVTIVKAPLLHKGKVRELYDLGDKMLIVVTDRISAFDYMLKPSIPLKGFVLNQLSAFWFEKTAHIIPNHVIHTDVDQLATMIPDTSARESLRNRIMVVHKAKRISVECVVRGYVTGGGWRQYVKSNAINGISLPAGMQKNQKFAQPIFTPAAKNDVGHDEDITIEQMSSLIGASLTKQLQEKSIELYQWAHDYCLARGIILADTKFEFGIKDGQIMLIDEIFTPDSSRYWLTSKYALDIEIDSMDKEPVRYYLAHSSWDQHSEPSPLPAHVVEATTQRYTEILHRLVDSAGIPTIQQEGGR